MAPDNKQVNYASCTRGAPTFEHVHIRSYIRHTQSLQPLHLGLRLACYTCPAKKFQGSKFEGPTDSCGLRFCCRVRAVHVEDNA